MGTSFSAGKYKTRGLVCQRNKNHGDAGCGASPPRFAFRIDGLTFVVQGHVVEIQKVQRALTLHLGNIAFVRCHVQLDHPAQVQTGEYGGLRQAKKDSQPDEQSHDVNSGSLAAGIAARRGSLLNLKGGDDFANAVCFQSQGHRFADKFRRRNRAGQRNQAGCRGHRDPQG